MVLAFEGCVIFFFAYQPGQFVFYFCIPEIPPDGFKHKIYNFTFLYVFVFFIYYKPCFHKIFYGIKIFLIKFFDMKA